MGELFAGLSSNTDLLAALTALALAAIPWLVIRIARRIIRRPLEPFVPVPLLGDSLYMALGDPTRFLFGRYKKYGSVFRLNLTDSYVYAVADLEAMRGVYYRDEGGVPHVPFITWQHVMEKYNILDSAHVHGPWRKALMSLLGPQGMRSFFPRVLQTVETQVRDWEANGKVPTYSATRRLGLDLSVDAIMDVQLSPQVDREWFKQQVETWLGGVVAPPVMLPGTALSRAMAAKKELLRVLTQESQREHGHIKRKWTESGGDLTAVSKQLAAESPSGLARFIDLQRLGFFGIGCTEVQDSAMAVLHAIMTAAETTRWALFNTWALLAMSPRVQDKLYEEQKQVISEYGPELSYEAVNNMPYMEAAIKECMRILTPSGGGLRKLTQDITVGDVLIPAGSTVVMFAHLMHCLDPVLWDGDTSADLPPHMDWRGNLDAAFRPERWLSEDTKPKHYFTFGSGIHLCAGQNMAYMEIKVVLSRLIRKYSLVLETPDMLARSRLFPFVQPVKGTDTTLLRPRDEPLPCVV